MAQNSTEVNIVLGNGLVPSGNVDPDLCHHMVLLGHNELINPHGDRFLGQIPQ